MKLKRLFISLLILLTSCTSCSNGNDSKTKYYVPKVNEKKYYDASFEFIESKYKKNREERKKYDFAKVIVTSKQTLIDGDNIYKLSKRISLKNEYNEMFDRYIQTGYGKTMSFNAWHYVEVLSGYLYNGGANNYMYNQIDSNGWATFKSTTTGSTTKSLGGLYYQWSGKVQIGTGSVAFKGTIQIWGANGSSKYNNSFNVQDRTAGSSFGSLGIGNITISGSNTVSQYTSSGTNWI